MTALPPASAAAAIPEALRAAVLERVRRLRRGDRTVVLNASVIGRSFALDVLAAATRRTTTDVRAVLERAGELQLIEAADAEAGTFCFRHALTRDVIYDELVATRTRPFHRRIARALERVNGAASPLEQLAYHWWAAGDARNGPRYNERAGDRARAQHAEAEAGLHYGRALLLLTPGSRAYGRLAAKLGTPAADDER